MKKVIQTDDVSLNVIIKSNYVFTIKALNTKYKQYVNNLT